MQNSARPIGHTFWRLGVGLGGFVHTLCPSAIAAPLPLSSKTPPDTADQTLLPNFSDAHFSLPASPVARADVLDVQSLPVDLDSSLDLAESQILAQWSQASSLQNHASTESQLKTQFCKSIDACNNAVTISIDAAGAAFGDLEASSHSNLDVFLAAGAVEADVLETEAVEADAALVVATAEVATELAVETPDVDRQHESSLLADALVELPSKGDAKEAGAGEIDSASSLDDLLEAIPRREVQPQLDDELGIIRANPLRSRGDEDLGVLRLLQRASAPPKPKRPIAFATGRLGYFNSQNVIRSDDRFSDQIYQSGLSFSVFPRLSENTSLYVIAEGNLGRFEKNTSNLEREIDRGYNEIELQVGVRQKLFPRTYAQIGFRNQQFFSADDKRKLLGINYIDTVISHRSILNSRVWLDSFYQARLGSANKRKSSRFRQSLTFSLNYGISKDLRTSLSYQLDLEDYTEISRYDVYQQFIGTISYRLTPESRLSLFGGTRFGRSFGSNSAVSTVNLDDTFYGAGLTVNLPLF